MDLEILLFYVKLVLYEPVVCDEKPRFTIIVLRASGPIVGVHRLTDRKDQSQACFLATMLTR